MRSGKAASDLNFAGEYGARVRLTGPVPIANEEFATVADGAVVNGIGTVLVVLFILWMALHSVKIIFAVFVNLFIGLSITTAVGLMMVGSLNLLSIAFAVLFVGLGVDFGIQFSVRYRSERFKSNDLQTALEKAAEYSAVPLSLAAMATAAGFLSFLPTDYKGVSELGEIAGVGMLVAFFSSITVLPALLSLLNPPGEKEPVGYAFLAPVDHFLEKHRVIIIVGTLLIAVAGLPLLYFLRFDFNPINLRNPKVEFDRHLSRSEEGPEHRRQRHQCDDAFGSRREEDRSPAGEGAGSPPRDVAGQFCARGPAGKAEADRPGRQGSQSGAQPGIHRCAAVRRRRMSRP